MYVIFPLDQLLDIDSADKITKNSNDRNTAGVQFDLSAKVLSPSHPVLQKQPNKQLPTSPEDQVPEVSVPQSAQGQGQRPYHLQEKLSKGSNPTFKSPSALPSSSPVAQPSQQQVPVASGNTLSTTCSSGSYVQGLQRQDSLLSPRRKNASACASWAGPPPSREPSSAITRSASFYLNRDSDANKKSPTSACIERSDSIRQQQVTKCEISRNDLIKSDSFRYNTEADFSSLKREQQSKGKKSRPPIPAEFKSELAAEFKDRRSGFETEEFGAQSSLKLEARQVRRTDSRGEEIKRPTRLDLEAKQVRRADSQAEARNQEIRGLKRTDSEGRQIRRSDIKAEGKSDISKFDLTYLEELESEANLLEGSGISRGNSNNSSRSRGSSGVGKVVAPKSSKALPSTFPTSYQPRQPSPSFAQPLPIMSSEPSFRDLSYPALNETLKSYNSVAFKLLKTVSEFSAQLSRLHERHAEDLQVLVESYRKKHSDLRNERPQCTSQIFQAWETLLQEVEVDSQLHSDIAGTFTRQVSRPLIEKTFHRKLQSRKLFTHRESIETILSKTEEMLKKCRKDHTDAYHNHCRTQSNATLAIYFDAHNAYVQQLHATNAMFQYYNLHTQPALLQELEEVHLDVNGIIMESIMQGADILAVKAQEQHRRYDVLGTTCRNSEPRTDVVALVKYLDSPSFGNRGIPHHRFVLPQPPPPPEGEEELQAPEIPSFPPLRNELVLDRLAALSSRNKVETLKRESTELEKQISQLQEGMDALIRAQLRNLESSLYHKANEIQEDISMKRFDLRVSQVHLAAVKAQRELFASKEGPSTESRERKMSGASAGTMKSKWMKAFKSLKTTGSSSTSGPTTGAGATSRDPEKKNGRDRGMDSPAALFENSHILQEYTYKKITACDVCHQILRGHSRQGLKCRLCKTNVHIECQERLLKCQPKSRLLRRQRSTSEIESKQMDPGDEENEPTISINSLIASQPGRRMKDPPSPSTPGPNSSSLFPLPPKGGQAPSNSGKRTLMKSFSKN